MSLKNCPQCQKEFNGGRALKEHMSTEHGGYSDSDIPNESLNQAKEILGSSSLEELAGKAPVTDDAGDTGLQTSKPDGDQQKRGRPKKTADEIEAQNRRKLAMEKIGGVICRKTASLPYTFWAKMAAQDALRLSTEEQKELSDAYLTIAQGYNADFSSPFMGILAALAINAEFVAKRLDLDLSAMDDEEERTGAKI